MKKLLFLGFNAVQIELARKFVFYRGLAHEIEVVPEQLGLSPAVHAYVINGDDPAVVGRLAALSRGNRRPVIGLGVRPAPGVGYYTAGAFKPATVDWLADILKKDASADPAAIEIAANVLPFPSPSDIQQTEVLVVDDSEIVRRTMLHKIKEYGHRVDLASDGNDALAMLLNNHYKLVFLDVMMPGLDGFEVCKRIKRSAQYKSLAVYMLSSKDGMFDKVRGSMAGCNGYLTKPLESARLREVMDAHLTPRSSRRESDLLDKAARLALSPAALPASTTTAAPPKAPPEAPPPQPDFRPTFASTEPGYMSDFLAGRK